jgi:hypothetical protein
MPCDGLVAWGSKLLASVRARGLVFATLCVLSVGCGEGDGRKKVVECRVDDDCDASTLGVCDVATCTDGLCELGQKPDGHRCDDSDPLTGQDACVSGICAGVVTTCDDPLGPCLKAVHDPETDECTVEPVDDDTPCDDADACTAVDSCQAGECVGRKAKKCKAADDCHVAGECDPQTGECSDVQADDGAPCDDGQSCTTDDACQDGACAGTSVTCDDGLACSVDSCDEKSGACAADMTACACITDQDCDDGNACNGTETCGAESKLCQLGTVVACPSSPDPCQTNVCVPETGACEAEPAKDGTLCDDADACTTGDVCRAGACAGADAVVCVALSQCHLPGVCNKLTGACSNPEKPANSACNDGNACSLTDRCQAGECVGGGQVICAASDQCHDVGVCNTATGICSKPNKQNGVKCSDANPCTLGDACQNGACAPASQVVCSASDSCHSAGSCDIKTGSCSNPAKADGSVCSDGLTCTSPDTCTAAKCGGAAVKCDDGVACTVDSCSEQLGGCTSNSAACACKTNPDCDDGNPCNGAETCNLQTLQCQPGKGVDCSALNDACNAGTCSPATGKCLASPKANGTTCDDGDLCTQGSSCQAGVCQGSSPVTCVASDQCHDAGSCNSATGVCSNPTKANGASCTDGNACTNPDTCQNGACTSGIAVVCSASDQCHNAGKCDTSSGKCTNPAKPNDSACEDGTLCTQSDTCQGGVCAAGSPVTCTASDDCHTAGSCDAKTGSCSILVKMNGSTCDDGLLCTLTDTCQSGVCSGNPVTCVASDQCHVAGSCLPASGKCSNPLQKNNTPCDDKNECTSGEACQTGACSGGTTVTCSASDQCHSAGACDPMTGKCSNPNLGDGTACNDGKTCTTGDTCTTGNCDGNLRINANGDWADDPGSPADSVDIFTDGKNNAHIVGTYTADVRFNDKDTKKFSTLALPPAYRTGIYWAVYSETGAMQKVANIGGVGLEVQGVAGTITVVDAAANEDGSFTIVGMVKGPASFGPVAAPLQIAASTATVYVAHYASNGNILWVAPLLSDDKATYAVGSVAAFDDGSVIVAGSLNGGSTFVEGLLQPDGTRKGFVFDGRTGVWAARLGADGAGQWASIVVLPVVDPKVPSAAFVANVTTHEDGSASLTGRFSGKVGLGPKPELPVSTGSADGSFDIWYEKLNKSGGFTWGGRVGGADSDLAGDVARIKGGGLLLMVNTLGGAVSGSDSKTTQQFLATATAGYQTHIVGIDSDGVMQTDALIGSAESGGTRGYQLKRDLNDFYGVAGVFATSTNFYSSVGFGSGPPKNGPSFTTNSQAQGPWTLFAARVDTASRFGWAVQAGGDKSGMITAPDANSPPWDVVMTEHPSHSITVAGMFKADASFGDQKTELLTVITPVGAKTPTPNPFVVHLNSQEEYDYCP